MAIEHLSSNDRPYMHSKRWRMKYNVQRLVSPVIYRRTAHATDKLRGAMVWIRPTYRYDEYLVTYYSKVSGSGPYPFREIPATIVTSEIGDGESDYQLDKVIVDAQYDTYNYGSYTYKVLTPDPVISIELRPTSYEGETPTLKHDLIALNMAAQAGTNPWKSRIQTPGQGTPSTNDVAATRESLILVCPFSKYRRCRVTLTTTQKMTTVRSLQLVSTEFQRRTFG